jgi:zinc protease
LGRGAILSRRLRDQNKLILRGETELLAYSDAGYLMATMEVEPDKIDRSQLAFLTELEIVKRLPPEAPDLERALAQLEREFWLTGQTVQERAANLAHFEAIGGGWKNRSSHLARLRKIKPAEISAAARKYLKLENCSMVEYLPNGAEARNITTEGIQRTFMDLVQVSTGEELAKREKATAPALHVPERADSFNYSEVRFPMQKASILRGPELFIKEDHTTPLIQMGIFFPGGKLFEKKENSGITALMLQSMLHGFKDTPADQFHQQLELYGAEIVPVVEDDYFGFHFTVLSKNIERAMDSLLQIIKSPRFDAVEVGQERKLQLASLGRQRESSRASAFRLLAQGLFGEFPYALNPLGTEASVASLDQEALKAWYKTTVENREPTVIIIGDTEGTNLARYYVRNFSGSPIQQTKIPEDFPKPVEKKVLLEENTDRSASAVAFGFQAPPEGDPDSAALAVLEKYATGPGGRLLDELREKQALVHEVSLAYRPRLRGGSVVIYLATAPDKEEAAQKALEEEIRRFAETPVLYKEYRTAVNQAVAAYWINQQSRQRLIVATMQNFLGGRELAVMNEYPARLQAVREEDLQEIAQRILKLERAVTVRLHGKSNR